MFDWFFGTNVEELRLELESKELEIQNLKKTIDELLSRDNESKAVYHAMSTQYEEQVNRLTAENITLKETITEMKCMSKKKRS